MGQETTRMWRLVIFTLFVDLTHVTGSVVGKGYVPIMCMLWNGRMTLFRCPEIPSDKKAIVRVKVETPDCTALLYTHRTGTNRSRSGWSFLQVAAISS